MPKSSRENPSATPMLAALVLPLKNLNCRGSASLFSSLSDCQCYAMSHKVVDAAYILAIRLLAAYSFCPLVDHSRTLSRSSRDDQNATKLKPAMYERRAQ